MKLLFEQSSPGRKLALLPECDVAEYTFNPACLRAEKPRLPELSEIDLSRHYSALCRRTHGVNNGFYPLGSCTMKYNPRVNELAAALPGFTGIHPLQCAASSQGALAALYGLKKSLLTITGMDDMTFQPAAGAHGEFTGLLLIKAYHKDRGDAARTKIIVPDAAHGTNPASAAMCGMTVVSIPSNALGCVDLDALRAAVGPDTAGLMLTNPNTLGLFDPNILEITRIVHEAGGLCYYDGANLNAVMGVARPGDMGFDVIHLNLHKTFSTPHGGGGPGAGPVGCKKLLAPFLPRGVVEKTDKGYALIEPEKSVGSVRAFWGNFLVAIRAYAYVLTLGRTGVPEVAEMAVLNANYMKAILREAYDVANDGLCMHEFVLTLEKLHEETGVSALDVAKALLDDGMHPPTMYFPLIVHEALMIEPTETESKETLDEACAVFLRILSQARANPDSVREAPHTTPVRRPDEVQAARSPVLRYAF